LLTGDLAATAARALGASRTAAAEPPLLVALQASDSDVQLAAAEALGRVGTAAAVMPLKDLAERGWSPALRKAARESIAEIQSRLSGASPGQLSIADGEAGQLSLADADPRGRVTIIPPQATPEKRDH
jgi:HEAT repeat protein